VAGAAIVLVLAGCGSANGSPSSTAGASPAAGASSAVPLAPSPSASTAAVAPSGSPVAPASPVVSVTIDPGLVDLLPATVVGVDVVESTATEDAARTSPRFADQASGFAAVEAIKSVESDLTIASIIALRPGVEAATFYADWRPGYDEAACGPAGGVSTRETQRIGGRSVDVTYCLEGATLYHVWLGDGQVLVSVLDVGTTGLGRALVEGATDPAP
jgi:hypothetical protein